MQTAASSFAFGAVVILLFLRLLQLQGQAFFLGQFCANVILRPSGHHQAGEREGMIRCVGTWYWNLSDRHRCTVAPFYNGFIADLGGGQLKRVPQSFPLAHRADGGFALVGSVESLGSAKTLVLAW